MKGIMFKEPLYHKTVDGSKTETRRRIDCKPATEKPMQTADGKYVIVDKNNNVLRKLRLQYKPNTVVYLKEPFCQDEEKTIWKFDMEEDERGAWKWKNKMFMPASTARRFIYIKEVKLQRVFEMTHENYVAEGTKSYSHFVQIWNQINKTPFNWFSNPWVFAYYYQSAKEFGSGTNKELGDGVYPIFELADGSIINWCDKQKKVAKSALPF